MVVRTNTVVESEFNMVAPEGVSIHCSRVYLEEMDVKYLLDLRPRLAEVVQSISNVDASSYLLGATAATFVGDGSYDVEVVRQLEDITGKPVVTAASAMLQGLRAVKARRIGVGTGYRSSVNERMKAFLERHGFEVVEIGGVDLNTNGVRPVHPLTVTDAAVPGLQPPEVAYKLGRRAYRDGVDAVYLAPAGLPTIEVIDALEADLRVPVLSSGQVSIWGAMQRAGVRQRIKGYGSLLDGIRWEDGNRE
jgi:maleate isomerase